MKTCIVFACTCLSDDRLFVVEQFVNSFNQNFQDSDIYIGINYGSVSSVEAVLDKLTANVKCIRVTDEKMYTKSDAGAYQAALKLLVESNQRYDNYWFLHTKGGVNAHSDYLRGWYIDHLINNRQHVESIMQTGVGSYGMLATHSDPWHQGSENYDIEIPLFSNVITDIFTCTKASYFYIHSIYVIGKGPMDIFLDNITDKFFNVKLNMYFFEGAMPYIASRTGYFPYVDNMISAHTDVDLRMYAYEWILQNRKEELTKYLTLPYRLYKFEQLMPPQLYVNSNT